MSADSPGTDGDHFLDGNDEPAGEGECELIEAGRRKDADVLRQREPPLRNLGAPVVEQTHHAVSRQHERQTSTRLAGRNEPQHRVRTSITSAEMSIRSLHRARGVIESTKTLPSAR
ncbi:hypothetical protein [Prescottella agglutinans]|uniref:hypothetical protein n=1 Tax=Prescottella agglutinans TaxID=1644129 RepID=UPI003D98228C